MDDFDKPEIVIAREQWGWHPKLVPENPEKKYNDPIGYIEDLEEEIRALKKKLDSIW